jgi:hypothetical protein
MPAPSLDILLDKLLSPLTAEEQQQGWTPEAKAGIAGYLRTKKVEHALRPLARDPSLVRGLDAWGVSGGDLYDEIMNFNRRLP